MFGRKIYKGAIKRESYDKENERPVIKASICNGDQVAGFRNIHTGSFTEIITIKCSRDLDEFLEKYGIAAEEIKKEY